MSKTYKHGFRKTRLKRRSQDRVVFMPLVKGDAISCKKIRANIEAQIEFNDGK